MIRKLLEIALIVSTLMATPVFAEVQEGAFTASLFEGGYTFDRKQHLKTNVAHGLRLGYNLNGNLGLEGQFTYVATRSTLDVPNQGDQYSLSGNLLYHFTPANRLVPFVLLGGGWSRTTDNYYYGDNDDGTIDYGGGIKYFIDDWVAMRVDLRHILSLHSSKYGGGSYWSNFEYTAGLSFQLGGKRTAPPLLAVAETPRQEHKNQLPAPQQAKKEVPRPIQSQIQRPVSGQLQPILPPPSPAPLAAGVPPAAAVQTIAPALASLPKPVVPVPQPSAVSSDCSSCSVNTVCNVVIGANGIEIISDRGIANYNVFRVSNPGRLVADICCATYGSGGKTARFDVNRMGISSVRVGTHPDKLRIVIDSPFATFPEYRMEKTGRGLNLLLNLK